MSGRIVTGADVRAIKPTLIRRECGGWLAVSERHAPINIGVVGDTEAETRQIFAESIEKWAQLQEIP